MPAVTSSLRFGNRFDQRARKLRALAHEHEAVERRQPRREFVDARNMLAQGFDLHAVAEPRPVREFGRHAEIIVEQRDAHVRSRWRRR